jgi:hypothetical protein
MSRTGILRRKCGAAAAGTADTGRVDPSPTRRLTAESAGRDLATRPSATERGRRALRRPRSGGRTSGRRTRLRRRWEPMACGSGRIPLRHVRPARSAALVRAPARRPLARTDSYSTWWGGAKRPREGQGRPAASGTSPKPYSSRRAQGTGPTGRSGPRTSPSGPWRCARRTPRQRIRRARPPGAPSPSWARTRRGRPRDPGWTSNRAT